MFLFFIIVLAGCEEEKLTICVTGNCTGALIVPGLEPDVNGYYHISFPTSNYYPRFVLYVEASKVIEPCLYNKMAVVEATFDTDTYWIMGDSLSVVIPLYNKFTSLYTSPYWNRPLPVGSDTVILNQYAGLIVPIVQTDTRIYLQEYFAGNNYRNPDEYKPTDPDKFLWSKRIVGPISPLLKGDTATIFMKLGWDCGKDSIDDDRFVVKIVFE